MIIIDCVLGSMSPDDRCTDMFREIYQFVDCTRTANPREDDWPLGLG